MSDFKKRLIEEKKALDEKIGKLISFLSCDAGEDIVQTQKTLLELQVGHMKNYASCINLRIEDLKNY